MRRIVVVAAGPAGITCALRVKRRRPEHEVNLVLPAGLAEKAGGTGPYSRRLATGLPERDLRAAREVGVLEVTDIQPDFARQEILVASERGDLPLRYSSLVLEIPAQSRAPGALQKAGNVFSLPADGFFAQAAACDAALQRCAETGQAVLVVGFGMDALDAVLAAREAHCKVVWAHTESAGAPWVDAHLGACVLRSLGNEVRIVSLPELPATRLDVCLSDDARSLVGFIAPEIGRLEAGCCLWAAAPRARHPVVREDGVFLDAHGRITMDAGLEEETGLYLIGGGAAGAPARLGGGAEAPVYAGGPETALALAGHVADRLGGRNAAFPGLCGVRRVRGHNLVLCRAGYTQAEAAAAGLPAEHVVLPLELSGGVTLILGLVCHIPSRTLLGVQTAGLGTTSVNTPGATPDTALGLFDLALCALAEGLPLKRLCARDWAGLTGRALARCASMLLYKLEGPTKGISPDELLASAAAGAEFFTLDVRPEREWLRERLPESRNIPIEHLGKRLQDEVPRFTPLVLVSRDGADAFIAAARLAGLGATDLYVLDGGTMLWPYEMQH